MKELKTESLESFVAGAGAKASADDSAPSEPAAADHSQSSPAEGGGDAPTGGGGKTPPSGSHGEVMPGMQLGKYKIIRRLGEGGMSAVFEAVHVDIHKPVAIKVLSTALSQQEEAQVRFLREAASASRLQHPHVVDVSDFGSESGRSYLVMELMRGEDLSQHIQRVGPMSTTALADVMLPICAGVQAAHDMKIVHRDLKPQNIFLCRTTMGGVVPKVLDFGISKVVDAETAALTHSGMMMGTPYYLSPEQIIQNSADHRSDQYALGVILYECATGRRPHEAETLYGILNSITQGSYPRPRAIKADMSEDFEAIILRALSQDAARRFPSVHALGRALMAFATERNRYIWQDYYANAPSMEVVDAPPPSVSTPASKSGSTEILSDVNRGAVTPGATRMLPEGMGSSSFRAQALAASNTQVNVSEDELAAALGKGVPKWIYAAGAALLLGIGLFFAFSGSDDAKVSLDKPAAAPPASTAQAETKPAMPQPVTTKGPSVPSEAPPPPKPEPVVAADPPPSAPTPARSRGTSSKSARAEKAERAERSRSGGSRSKAAEPTAPPAAASAASDPAAKKRSVEKSGGVPILE